MLLLLLACSKSSPYRAPLTMDGGSFQTMGTTDKAYAPQDDPAIGVDDLGPRRWKVVDVHEHLRNEADAVRLLAAMNALGIRRACLLGASAYTLTLSRSYGFEGYIENNDALLAIKRRHEDRFCVFVTINPMDADNLRLLQGYVAKGADGLKLYVGHGGSTGKGPFHSMPIDDPRLEPVFAWAERVQLPIVLHVNLDRFWDELVNVLEKHPYLRVDIPHFGLQRTGDRLRRLGYLMDRYPYLYTDLSAGYPAFETEAFETFARHRDESRTFFETHSKKILFGADMVVESHKDDAYIVRTPRSYMQFLERERWRYVFAPSKVMYGLGLSAEALRRIYEDAPHSFLLMSADGKLPDRTQGWPLARVGASELLPGVPSGLEHHQREVPGGH